MLPHLRLAGHLRLCRLDSRLGLGHHHLLRGLEAEAIQVANNALRALGSQRRGSQDAGSEELGQETNTNLNFECHLQLAGETGMKPYAGPPQGAGVVYPAGDSYYK